VKQRRAVKAQGDDGNLSAPVTPRDATPDESPPMTAPASTSTSESTEDPNGAVDSVTKRPPATLAGRFFGTVHAPATVHKIKTLLLFDAMPINPRARPPSNLPSGFAAAARDATSIGIDVSRSARVPIHITSICIDCSHTNKPLIVGS
jgi:hypothetical protein